MQVRAHARAHTHTHEMLLSHYESTAVIVNSKTAQTEILLEANALLPSCRLIDC